MSQLPSDFEKIVIIAQQFYESEHKTANAAIRYAVERCYALANKPVRELTAEEIYRAFDPADEHSSPEFHNQDWLARIRNILMAHQRKQQEPETVTFRAARHKADNRVSMLQVIDDANIASCWEWLPGEPQTIEVKLP